MSFERYNWISMFDEGVEEKLKAMGFSVGKAVRTIDHRILYQINNSLMFEEDAVALASGDATFLQIIQRNRGRVS